MRFAQAALDQPLLTFFEFGLQQRFQETEMGPALTHRLLGELAALRGDGRQMQDLALLFDGGHFERAGLGVHDATAWSSRPS